MSLLRRTIFTFALLAGFVMQGYPSRTNLGPGPVQPFSVARPFPHHTTYARGIILPNHISRQVMDDSVRSFYNAWKQRYIKKGCGDNEFYVWFEGTEVHNKQCVSEGQGYGMVITALMAGYDTAARTIYDGLFRYYRSHPSKNDRYLMAWAQKKGCRDIDGSSASDGDMDIAYSLLLAETQWGNDGAVAYGDEARRIIDAIMKGEINQRTFSVLLTNSSDHYSKDFFDMRSSDFMPAHFRAFRNATHDSLWNRALDSNYKLFRVMQKRFSPDAGLFPDFINKINTGPRPAKPNYLEARHDGDYNYNACRIPWRIATDYIVNGEPRAEKLVRKMNTWIRGTTKGKPDNISAGYGLNGEDLEDRYYEALCFIAPFAVAAMIDDDNQLWLNRLWDYLTGFQLKGFDYYDNSIKLINMLIISGNYWAPGIR